MKFGSCAENATTTTIGAAYMKVSTDPVYDLSLWDTAGGERFQSLMPMYVRNSEVCLVVFDCTKIETLEHAAHLFFHFTGSIAGCDEALWILVGCKNDMKEKVVDHNNIDFLKEKFNILHIPHFFVSNTSGQGVGPLKEHIYNHLRLHDAELIKKLEEEKEKTVTLNHVPEKETTKNPFTQCCQK